MTMAELPFTSDLLQELKRPASWRVVCSVSGKQNGYKKEWCEGPLAL